MPDFNFSFARAYALIIDGISEKHPTHPAHVAPNLRSGVGDMGGVFFFLPYIRACARQNTDKRLVKISRRERKTSRPLVKTSRPLVNVARPRVKDSETENCPAFPTLPTPDVGVGSVGSAGLFWLITTIYAQVAIFSASVSGK